MSSCRDVARVADDKAPRSGPPAHWGSALDAAADGPAAIVASVFAASAESRPAGRAEIERILEHLLARAAGRLRVRSGFRLRRRGGAPARLGSVGINDGPSSSEPGQLAADQPAPLRRPLLDRRKWLILAAICIVAGLGAVVPYDGAAGLTAGPAPRWQAGRPVAVLAAGWRLVAVAGPFRPGWRSVGMSLDVSGTRGSTIPP